MPIPTRRASDLIVPYCAPVGWYRGAEQALAAATRHPNRATFEGGMLLTVPVEGGARALKSYARGGGAPLRVSLHGRWPHVHLGALEAMYGRTPFFPHYFPSLSALIASPPEMLADLNAGIDRVVRDALHLDRLAPMLTTPTAAVVKESRRLRQLAGDDISMVEALFRYGPEAIFLLVER